jgi:hypothetical protein
MAEPAYRKYLEKYAEPEARFAPQLQQPYAAALVVPAYAEDASLLADLEPALNAAAERVLLIVVVNATEGAEPATHATNQRLLEALHARLLLRQDLTAPSGCAAAATLGRAGKYDLLLIDRASPGRRLPLDQGVGLARRIGMDVGLGLYAQGGLASAWLGCTDGDARLPVDYFAQNAATPARGRGGTRRVALTLPFQHVTGGHADVDQATAIYELSLRYYTLGLASAGSPYAYESLGSCIVALAEAYAEVRGFPRRQAGEDFYLLDKLAKVGSVHRPEREPILLRSRASARVPFGTGARVAEIVADGGGLTTYHPRVFELLGLTYKALTRAVVAQREDAVTTALSRSLDAGSVGAVASALEELQAFEALREMFSASPAPGVRIRRLFTWFDALRTLRFIHLVETRAGLSRLPVLDALASAPFCDFWQPGMSENSVRNAAFSTEQALPSDIGVESAISASVNDH